MTFKEKVDNHFGLFVMGLLLAGFLAGIATYKAIMEIAGLEAIQKGSAASATSWKETARKENWIPLEECPAFPLTIKVTSPGDGSHVGVSEGNGTPVLYSDLVILASRAVPLPTSIGAVFNEQGDSNYYVAFPVFTPREPRSVFRENQFIFLPFKPKPGAILNIWGLAVNDQHATGSVFSSLQQIRDSSASVVLSDKISVNLTKHSD